MSINGVAAEWEWEQKRCPFCHEKLGKIAGLKRKIKKTYQCPNCHRKVDERIIIH